MLQPIFSDSRQYIEEVKGPIGPTESNFQVTKNIYDNLLDNGGYNQDLIRRQWEYAKQSIKKWKNPRTLVQLGDVHLIKNNNLQRAREYYIEAINEDETYFLAYDRLLFCLLKLNELELVNQYYQRWVSVSNRRTDILHQYVIFQIFYRKKCLIPIELLLNELNEILIKEPENFSVLDTKGFVLLNMVEDIPAARDCFVKALKINSNYIHSLNSLGVTYLREKKFDDALKQFVLAIKVDDKYPPAYENIASTYAQLNDQRLELEILSTAIKNNVCISKEWEHKIGLLKLQQNQIDDAIEWYTNKIKSEPNNNLLYNNLGICYIKKNDIAQGKIQFEKSITVFKTGLGARDERSILAFYNLARILIDLNDYKSLGGVISEIKKVDPRNTYIKYLYGIVSIKYNEYDRAKSYFEEVISENPMIQEVYADYAFILECVDRDYQKAVNIIKLGLQRGFNNKKALNNLAYAYIRMNKLVDAEEIINKISKPFNPELIATMGLLAIRKGNLVYGNKMYEKAIEELKDKKDMQLQAERVWKYEQALYFCSKSDYRKSRKILNTFKDIGESYLTNDIKELSDKLKSYGA